MRLEPSPDTDTQSPAANKKTSLQLQPVSSKRRIDCLSPLAFPGSAAFLPTSAATGASILSARLPSASTRPHWCVWRDGRTVGSSGRGLKAEEPEEGEGW